MYYTKDRDTAARALLNLRSARLAETESTLDCLYRARNEVASSRTDDKLRLQAWVSIRRLYEAYKTAPERDLKPLWQDAIAKTDAWCESMKRP